MRASSRTSYASFRKQTKLAFGDKALAETDRRIRTLMALVDYWTRARGPLGIPGFGVFYRKRLAARTFVTSVPSHGPSHRLAFRASKHLVVHE